MTTNRNIGVSLTADPSQMQAGLRTAASSAQQFAVTTDTAFGRVSAASARLVEASKAVAAASNQQTLAARAQQAAADRFVRDLERQATAIGKTRSELLALQAAELGVADKAAPFIARIRESEQALDAGAIQFNKYGLSAKQAEAAMRGVPAQITDIVVALQGGQRPMTVLLQQGGQLKDMFGGIVPAAQALGSTMLKMVNPVVLAGGALAGLYAAYRAGASEAENFNRTLITSGNALGVTVDQLNTMAGRLDAVAGTQRRAAAALNEFAGTGRIAANNLEQFTASAIAWERATGAAISDTAKHFVELGKAPVEASLKLNESMNYLTTSTYQQIKALQDSGRETEAAALAQKLFADTIDQRSPQILQQVGAIERAWHAVKGAVTGAVDAMMDIGRPETIESLNDRLQNRLKQLAALQEGARFTDTPGGAAIGHRPARNAYAQGVIAQEAQQLAAEIQMLQQQLTAAQIVARERKELEEQLLRDKYVGDPSRQTRDQQRIEAIQKEEKAFQRAIQGLSRDSKEYERIYAAHKTALLNIDKQFEEKRSGGISATQTELARLRAALEAEKLREEQLHASAGALSTLNEHEKLAIQYGEKLKLTTDGKVKAQLLQNKALAEEAGARKRANDVFEKELKDRQSAIDTARKQTLALRDQIETYGMGKSAIEELTIARLEERLAIAEGNGVSEATIDSLRRELDARRELLNAMRTKEALDTQLKEWQAWEKEVDRIFGQLGQSFTDHLFEGGKSARDMIRDLFKSLVLRVAVQPMLSGLQGMVTQQLGGMLGFSDPRQGGGVLGTAQGLHGVYNAFSGGLTNTVSNSIGWLGEKFGSSALQSFAAGMTGFLPTAVAPTVAASLGGGAAGTLASGMASTSFSASLGGGAAAAGGGAASAGAAFGAALPWIGGALAIGSLLGGGLFDREPTTRREQRTQVEYAGGIFDITKTDDRAPAGADAAARALAEQAVATANDIFRQVGVDAAIDSFHAIMASSYAGDRDGVASGGRLRIGDEYRQFGIANEGNPTIQGFGGWSSAETLPRLAVDTIMSMMEALQMAGVMEHRLGGLDIRGMGEAEAQELAATIQRVVQEIAGFDAVIAHLPFENLRNLSFEARDGLLALTGGLDNFIASEQSYIQNFLTEAERTQLVWDEIGRVLGGVNIAVPETRAEFHAIKTSLDLSTESGREAYAAIMAVQGAFASVTQSADELAAAAQRAAEDQRRAAEQARQQALSDLSTAYNAVVQAGQRDIARLQESFGATDSAMSAYRSAVQRLESEFNSLFTAIDRGVQALRGTGAAFDAQYHQARAVISTTLLTGQLPQTADLSEALRIAQQGVTGQVYASRFDQEKAYATLANEMEAIKKIAEPELDAAQATLEQLENQYRLLRGMSRVGEDSLESLEAQLRTAMSTEEAARYQISVVEQQLEAAREQYNALMGIDDTLTKGFADLVAAFQKAAAVVPPAMDGGGGGGGWDPSSYAAKNPDLADYYARNPADRGGLSFDQWLRKHYDDYGSKEGRAFARGGFAVPGWALVGEEGPELVNFSQPGRVYTASQTNDILRSMGAGQGGASTREMVAEIRLLRAEVSALRNEQKTSQLAIAKNTMKTAKRLDEFGDIGMPVREEITA